MPLWAIACGWVAAGVGIGGMLTNLRAILRVRSARGVSFGTWGLSALANYAWIAYAWTILSPTLMVANTLQLLYNVPLTWLKLSERSRSLAIGGLIACAAYLALMLELAHIHAWWPTIIATPTGLTIAIPQIVYVMRKGRGPGVSVVGWTLAAVSAALWLTYGIAGHYGPIILNAGIQTGLMITAVTVLLVKGPSDPGLIPFEA